MSATTETIGASTLAPKEVKQMGSNMLGVAWNDGHTSIYRVRNVRLACRCAHCVDEWTQEPKLSEDSVPADIRPKRIESVGRYALRFVWSDGHDTGIYPFANLRKLCECPSCKHA